MLFAKHYLLVTKKFHKIKLQIGMSNHYFIIQIPISSHMCDPLHNSHRPGRVLNEMLFYYTVLYESP